MVMHFRWQHVLAVMAGCLMAFRMAGAPSFTAQIEPGEIPLGESATLKLVFTDFGDAPEPVAPEIPNATVAFRGRSVQSFFSPTASGSSLIFQYGVTPKAQGVLTIPAIVVEVDGKRYTSNPLELRVGPGRDLSRIGVLRLSSARSEVYVGETFPIEIRFYFRHMPAQQAPPTLNLEGFLKGRQRSDNLQPEMINGVQHGVVRWSMAVTAVKPGEFDLGPAELLTSYRFDTGRGFFGGIETRPLNFTSEPLHIRVLPPPAAGRPATFDGAVGRFQSKVTVSSTNVAVGDPITVRVAVSGSGNFDGLRLPELPTGAPFQSYPGTNSFAESDPLGLTGTKTFELVLVPEQPGEQALRWPVWSSWDPTDRRYLTPEARLPRIQVRPGTATQAQPTGSHVAPAAPAAPNPAGLSEMALKPEAGVLEAPSHSVVTGGGYWVIWGLPLAAYAGASTMLWWRRRRREDPAALARQRSRHAVSEALANLKVHAASGRVEPFYAALNTAVQSQLALTLGGVPGSFTEEVIESRLVPRGLSEEEAAQFRRVLATLAQARFAPGTLAGTPADHLEEAERAIRVLRRLEETR